jgi:hypothetical protein
MLTVAAIKETIATALPRPRHHRERQHGGHRKARVIVTAGNDRYRGRSRDRTRHAKHHQRQPGARGEKIRRRSVLLVGDERSRKSLLYLGVCDRAKNAFEQPIEGRVSGKRRKRIVRKNQPIARGQHPQREVGYSNAGDRRARFASRLLATCEPYATHGH